MTVDINFQVLNTKDPKTILIGDSSQWGIAENQPAYLLIKPPGATNTINLNFPKHRITILNSVALGLSCIHADCNGQSYEDLDDGVWEFCLQSSFDGLNKKRFYLKDDQLRQEIAKIRIALLDTQGFTFVESSITKQLRLVEDMLSVANDLILEGRNRDAMKAYSEANKIVEKHKQCKDCI